MCNVDSVKCNVDSIIRKMPNEHYPQYDIDIVDGEQKSVGPMEHGELVIRVDKGKPLGLFKGYYRDEDMTKERIQNGLYYTGDIVYRDEDGYLWFVSRSDDVIKTSGYRVGPFEGCGMLRVK